MLLVQALTSCGSDDPASSVCVPNESQACTGPGQCVGFQVCAADGKSFGACDCGSGGTGGSASGGTGGSGGGGGGTSNAGSTGMGGPLFPGAVGLPCDAASACPGAPMVCILESSNTEFQFGGPQGGYCSVPCTTNAECTAVDSDSACNTALGYCLALCQPGAGAGLVKCGSGRAQYCVPITNDGSVGACLPGCTSDAACGDGRFCDPGLPGLCVDELPPGGALGAPCTEANQLTDCASGFCLEYADPNDPAVTIGSFCSANCTAGVNFGCGFDDVSTGARQAACFEPRFSDGGVGDIGACFPLCDTTADCVQANAGWTCLLFTDPAGATQLGRQGECVPPGVGVGAADAGPG